MPLVTLCFSTLELLNNLNLCNMADPKCRKLEPSEHVNPICSSKTHFLPLRCSNSVNRKKETA